VKKVYLLRTVM